MLRMKNGDYVPKGSGLETVSGSEAVLQRVLLRLSKLGLEGFFRVAEAENRFSAREGAVMTWTLKECE